MGEGVVLWPVAAANVRPAGVWADLRCPCADALLPCRGMRCASACTNASSPSGRQRQPSQQAPGSSRSREGRQRLRQTWLAAALRLVVHLLALAWPALHSGTELLWANSLGTISKGRMVGKMRSPYVEHVCSNPMHVLLRLLAALNP